MSNIKETEYEAKGYTKEHTKMWTDSVKDKKNGAMTAVGFIEYIDFMTKSQLKEILKIYGKETL